MVLRRGTTSYINTPCIAIHSNAFRALFFIFDKNVVTLVVNLAFSWGHTQIKAPGGPQTPVADTDGSAATLKSWTWREGIAVSDGLFADIPFLIVVAVNCAATLLSQRRRLIF